MAAARKQIGAFDYMKAVEALRINPLRRKLILLVIARGCNANGVCTHVGIAHLATAAQCDEKTVRRNLDALEAAGLIERHRRNSQKGRLHNRYVLRGPLAIGHQGTSAATNGHSARSSGHPVPSPAGTSQSASGPSIAPVEHQPDHLGDHPSNHQGVESRQDAAGGIPIRPRPIPRPQLPSDRVRTSPDHSTRQVSPDPTGHSSVAESEPDWEAILSEIPPHQMQAVMPGGVEPWRLGFRWNKGRLIAAPDWYPVDRYVREGAPGAERHLKEIRNKGEGNG